MTRSGSASDPLPTITARNLRADYRPAIATRVDAVRPA